MSVPMKCQQYRKASKGERVMGALFPSRGAGWPGSWSSDRVAQVQHITGIVYQCIDTISSVMAQILPNIAYVSFQKPQRILQKWRTPQQVSFLGHTVSTCYYRKALSVIKPHEELEPVEHDHPLRRLIENPNAVDTYFDLMYELDLFLEACGCSYLWKVPNGYGKPTELWTIPAHWVWPRTGGGSYVDPNSQNAGKLISYYEVRPWGTMGSAGMLIFPPEEVIMFPWKSPLNKIDGYSRLSAIAQWIDSEESISKSRWAQFVNQARPEFWVELGPGFEDPDDDRIQRIETKFAQKYASEMNFGKPIFTPSGSKVKPLSFSPTEMSYYDSFEQLRGAILSAFRIPPAALGLSDNMTFGSILAVLGQFALYCINPRLAMMGLRMTKELASVFSTPERPIKIWWDDVTPPDPDQLNKDIAQDIAGCAVTPNEIRATRGRAPFAHGGDDPLVDGPGGKVPLPLQTGEDWTDLADLVPVLGKPRMRDDEIIEGPSGRMQGGENLGGVDSPNGDLDTLLKSRKGYFNDCPRDDNGHCLPSGTTDKPAGSNPASRVGSGDSDNGSSNKPHSRISDEGVKEVSDVKELGKLLEVGSAGTLADLKREWEAGHPVLCQLAHRVAVIGFDGDDVVVQSGILDKPGRVKVPADKFVEAWDGKGISVGPKLPKSRLPKMHLNGAAK